MSSWEWIKTKLASDDVFSLVVPLGSASGGPVLAGTMNGLYSSTDSGQSWRPMTEDMGAFPVTSVACAPGYPKDPTIIVGGPQGVVLRSVDGGGDWLLSRLGFPDVAVTVLAISPSFSRDGLVLAGTAEDGIYRSTTRGRLWAPVNFGLLDLRVWDLILSPAWETDQTAFAVAGDSLFRTTNGARAWKDIGADLEGVVPQSAVTSPDFGRDGTVLLGTEGDGVWRSLDRGDSWEPAPDTRLTAVDCLAVSSACDTGYSLYAGTAENGILCSRDGGESWVRLGGEDWPAVLSLVEVTGEEGRVLLAAVHGEGVFRLRRR